MNKSEDINEIVKALAKVQKEIKNPKKDANNPFFKSKYSTLDSVIETYKELCSQNDVVVMENPVSKTLENGNTLIGIEVLLMHSSGQFINFDPYLLSPVKNDPQGIGSSITYARRYTLSSVFNIASEDDDDGNNASGNNSKPQQSPSGQQSNDRMANEKQMKLLHFKVGELAKAYDMTVDKIKTQLKVSDNMKEVDFKAALKRAQDGLDKVQAENNTQGSNE